MLPNLARIINPVLPKLPLETNNSMFVYRQILENPYISKEISKNIEKILEAYAEWLLEEIDAPGCEANLETRSDCEMEIEKFIALTKANKLAEHELQKVLKRQSLQIEDAKHLVRQKLRESAHKAAEGARQQSLLQSDIDEDWRLFIESKGGPFVCMHKPTDLLQRDPPFHPLSDTRFLFFHAEEGLRYLFICEQKMNEAKRWSIETMPPSPVSSIHSNEYFKDLTEGEENELTNMFSEMIGKAKELSKEVVKAEEDEKKRKEGEKFCKQVFSDVLVPKDPFHDFTADKSSSEEEEERCIFDYPPKPEKKPEPRPPHVYEFSPALPPPQSPSPTSVPQSTASSSPPPLPISPKSTPAPLPPPKQPEPPKISEKEKNKLARDAWRALRMAEKESRLNNLGPNWAIPQEFDYDYEIYMRARAFKKAFKVPKWKGNEFYITRELPNERPMQMEINERMKLAHDQLNALDWIKRQFRIFPPLIDFHIVQLGTMRMKIVIVQNYHGPRSGRIFIHKEDKLSVKFHYFHGSIAPGMYVVLRVYFRASKLGLHLSQAEIMTDTDVYTLTIKAIVISGVAPPDPDDQIEVVERNPCDEPIDPWGTFILCRRCLTHHLHWWSKNWGLYECTKCWHFHITQEWLDAIAEKARQKRLADEAKKANRG
ncbi:hypothetical protein KC19_4G038500 [Ceratodon purpureus]|uniref:Uncharacterized protein n=1 Tax=Ceratodon purpureus TaxID=3225 RepID=A0A8T0I4X5_CERPU|nr:hypothetical protein KC19_4G038500 [Ceratodon purpureus]